MYKFVRVEKINPSKGDKAYWFFEPSSVEQITEHWKKYCCSVIRKGIETLLHKTYEGHFTNEFETAVEHMHMFSGNNLLVDMVKVENEAYQSRIGAFYGGDKIYLSHGMQVYMLDERFFHITEEVEKDKLTFPDEERPSLEDVKYMQWPGGYHWYAKVGKLDVTDERGEQKWNTKKEAEEASKWFIVNNF